MNLKELFPQYKITFDPAATGRNDPHMMQIPCVKGIIYPHAEGILALECKTYTARCLRQLSGVTIHQEGDSEWTLLFPIGLFDQVAAIVQPKKRRFLTPAQRAAAVERLRKYQFSK